MSTLIRTDPKAKALLAAEEPSGIAAIAGIPLLRLLHLSSPTLPIGAFAYSQALEQAVALGWVSDEVSAEAWIVGLLTGSVAGLDLPVLARIFRAFACEDLPTATWWSELLLASRGSAELQMEDLHLGTALARVLDGLGVTGAAAWIGSGTATHATLFALAAVRWQVPLPIGLAAFAFSWTEAQVAAATRLCPLGQQAAQRILARAAPAMDAAAAHALGLEDDEVGAAAPAQAIASALHETLYSRMCRS